MTAPQYAIIKQHLRQRIERGELKPGDRVPSENQLLAEFGVSRMTARRALLELAETGLLLRSQGLGTFVADTRPVSSINQIRDIAEEIRLRGRQHSCRLLQHRELIPGQDIVFSLGLNPGEPVFHSVLLHLENAVLIQRESRYVNPTLAPDYLQQDFRQFTPSAYLSQVAPLTEADQSVEAILPTSEIADQLGIEPQLPCLRISRRTFSQRGVVSLAELIHPGDRYRLGSHINCPNPGIHTGQLP